MGYCNDDQYDEFLSQAPLFEQMLIQDNIRLFKFWFSVSRGEQHTRFLIRRIDPVRRWKLSPTDVASLTRWGDYTEAKERMFAHTDTEIAPWTIVKSNDKRRGRLNAMRHVLSAIDYEGKDPDVVGTPDPLIVGRASSVFEVGEHEAPAGHAEPGDAP
jgi:polyphosphate kinase 2 (PPK2 family)